MHVRHLAPLALTALALAACGHKTEKAALPEAAIAARAVRVGKPATRLETGLARATGRSAPARTPCWPPRTPARSSG